MAEKLDVKIEAVQEKLKQLKAQKQKQEARVKAVESKKKRSDDTRRKILLGSVLLTHIAKDQWLPLAEKHLTKDADRALFGLSISVENTPQKKAV